jgi:protein-S-isoprenylcysteine O-methyltransferase Ste14
MLKIAFITIVAYGTFVCGAATLHGRRLRQLQRAAVTVAIAGVVLVLPCLLLGACGFPSWYSVRWILVTAYIGYAGIAAIIAGGCTWLVADTIFVMSNRRRIFPFAFRGGQENEPGPPGRR